MNTEAILSIVLAIISMVSGCGWIVNRRKYKQEVENLKAETLQKYMDLAKEYVEQFRINIVEPLQKEVHNLRTEINQLKDAIEKVNDCPYRDNCPVRKRLHNVTKSDV